MADKILVALKRGDGAEEIVPYIEDVAKAGTKVVFLVQYPVTAVMEYIGMAQGYVAAIECGAEENATMAMSALGRAYSWEEQVRLAGQTIFPACKGLQKKGVEIEIDLYGNYDDSLKKAVERYTRNGRVQLIMTRPGVSLRFMNFLQETVGLLGLRKRPSFYPVLVVHPSPRV